MNKFVPILFACAMAASTTAFAQTTSPSPATPPAATSSAQPPAQPMNRDTTTVTPPSPTANAPAVERRTMMMTDAEAKNWINKTVYSSDAKNVGEISAIKRDEAGNVTELHADIGGFLGIGETRVRLAPDQVKIEGDRLVLNMTAEQAKSLPPIAK